MEEKTLVDGAGAIAKAIRLGKRAATAVKKEVPIASSAVTTKVMKFNQEKVRPITEPVARTIVEKVVRPTLDTAGKVKKTAVQWLESPDHKYIQDDKKNKLGVRFKEAAYNPVRIKRTVAEPQKGVLFKGMPQPRVPETKPAIGDKRSQAQQLIARRADPKTVNPAPAPAKRPTKTK